MKEVSDISVCVIDHGQFMSVADRMALDCKQVYYFCPQERAARVIAEGILGDGFQTFDKVESWLEVINDCDLFVFPDIGYSAEQRFLLSQGKAVWGARDGDRLESNRGLHLKVLKEVGLPVPVYEVIKGLNNLRLHLKDEEDKYVKISKWRGDFETFHWRSWKQDETELDKIAVRFGPAKELVTFYVFDPIDAEIEDGIDTYCVDGQWPGLVLHGMENKDKSFIGQMRAWDDLPAETRIANEKMGPVLADYGYRGFFSTEVRITDDKESYFIDPTCRCPSPPFQLQCDLFGNYSDIIWQGANGNCIDPEPTAKFGVQALLSLDKGEDEWAATEIPQAIRRQIKPMFACEMADTLVFPPSPMCHMVAWLTATGDTIEKTIKTLQEHKAELPDNLKCEDKSLADLLVEMTKAEEKGIEIDAEIPEPATVLEAA